jgi:potassium-transporting ATPase KdpC subunit
MRKVIYQTLSAFIVLSLATGLAYPLFITGISQAFFSRKASASLVVVDGKVMGSEFIGQKFWSPKYFHGRPSANDYDASNSGASNFGPANRKYLDDVSTRIAKVRAENGLLPEEAVPADLVLASASGLDPHISLEAATLQIPRITKTRGVPREEIMKLVLATAERPYPGGRERINVLRLNIALDKIKK